MIDESLREASDSLVCPPSTSPVLLKRQYLLKPYTLSSQRCHVGRSRTEAQSLRVSRSGIIDIIGGGISCPRADGMEDEYEPR